jgi:hypothetical protein
MNDLQGICHFGQVIEALIGDSSCQLLTWQTGERAPDHSIGIHDVARDCREKGRETSLAENSEARKAVQLA